MDLSFPSRFLKKLGIYQQIRAGQGISKHKYLWKYEAAFLQNSYGKNHQHLSNFVSRTNLKKWIEKITPFNPKQDENQLNHIIANLFWRGYIDVVERINSKRAGKSTDMPKGLKLLDKKSFAFKSDEFGDEKSLDYRATMEGLLVGEILSEINNKNKLLKSWNKYKYSFILDFIWLLIFWGILNLFAPEILQFLQKFSIKICSIKIGTPWTTLIFVFAIWPLLSFVFRNVYLWFEDNQCSES